MRTKLGVVTVAAAAMALWPASSQASHGDALGECTMTTTAVVSSTPVVIGPVTIPGQDSAWTECRDWFTTEAATSASLQATATPTFTGTVNLQLCLFNSGWTSCDKVLNHAVRFVSGVAVDPPAADVELTVGTWELRGSYATRTTTTPSVTRCYYPGPCVIVPGYSVQTTESAGSFTASVVAR